MLRHAVRFYEIEFDASQTLVRALLFPRVSHRDSPLSRTCARVVRTINDTIADGLVGERLARNPYVVRIVPGNSMHNERVL